MDTLRTGRTEDTARGENEPLAAKPGEKCGLELAEWARQGVEDEDDDEDDEDALCWSLPTASCRLPTLVAAEGRDKMIHDVVTPGQSLIVGCILPVWWLQLRLATHGTSWLRELPDARSRNQRGEVGLGTL